MKPINLLSFLDSKNNLPGELFSRYLELFNINKVKESEINDISLLVDNLKKFTIKQDNIFDQYYLGFTINQIGKEFDLLRFGVENIINIELKKENTGERIKEQLIKNKYYLSFLKKEVYSFTYVSDDNTLYYLDEYNQLINADFKYLIELLDSQNLYEIDNIQSLFNPSNYLISPFNSTKEFIEGNYFLTNHQMRIKKQVEEIISSSEFKFITIEGSAGTGKTLLAYDIAQKYINDLKNVIIIHCGILNDGHCSLRDDYGWNIIGAKGLKEINLENYDIILVDEVQRMHKLQLENLIDTVKKNNIKCIFSYDKLQCMASFEIKRDNPKYIEDNTLSKNFVLTEKIRTNKEIASFIKNLFDLSKINRNINYSNIDIQYFSNTQDAKNYMKIIKKKGWKIINYTPSLCKYLPYEDFMIYGDDNAHKVIGQEFDNVVAVIDSFFYYNENQYLSTKGYSSRPYYHPTKMLFQILTRTRKKLTIIIINNQIVLEKCMNILKHN